MPRKPATFSTPDRYLAAFLHFKGHRFVLHDLVGNMVHFHFPKSKELQLDATDFHYTPQFKYSKSLDLVWDIIQTMRRSDGSI